MVRTTHVFLPDGRRLDYKIRVSKRSKSLRLKITARDGLIVIAPQEMDLERLTEIVAGKSNWIMGRLHQFDEVRQLMAAPTSVGPQAFVLPALAESWLVEYRETRSKTVAASTDQPGRIIVYGAICDQERCQAALRRWLARRAKDTLGLRLNLLAEETGLKFGKLTIKSQRTRWGSCSATGVISLNCKLLFLPPKLVRYVMIHELCHTLEQNHSSRFWMMVRQYEPSSDVLHGSIREAWKQIPAWAYPIRASREEL
jgi:predicted metal-dependent hydrolase